MNFTFEGFSAAYNILFLIALLVFTLGVAYWTYRNVSGVSKPIRGVLITLRASVFLILILLLLNPVFTILQENRVKPEIAVLLDNSQSTIIEKGIYSGETDYKKAIGDLGLADTSNILFKTWAFSNESREMPVDSLNFSGTETDINTALTTFREQMTDEIAVILISDGIINKGRDPSYAASRFPLPIFTIALGDTSRLDDIVVQNVTSNSTGYKNTSTPVEVSVFTNGFPNTNITVQLMRDGKVIDEQIFQSDQSMLSVQDISFEVELESVGLQQYEINIPEVEGEWTTANNQEVFNIDVLDDKVRIMHLAFDIHPDVKTVRSILRSDDSIDLDYRTWIAGERFVEGDFPQNQDTLDLIILHGFPSGNQPETLIQQVREYTQGKPIVFLSGVNMDYNLFTSLYGDLSPVTVSSDSEKRDVRPLINSGQKNHPVLELPEANLDRAPPLYGPVDNINSVSGSQILMITNFRGTDLETPMLTTRTIGNIRTALLSAHGFYRWFLSPDVQLREYTIELFNNIVKWTASPPDNRLLDIQPTKTMFNETENVLIDAFLRNEAGQEENNAIIEVEISGDGYEDRLYKMSNQGRGQYRLRLGNLPEGMYQFDASAMKGNHIIEERTGEFSVGSTNLEFVNTKRNDALLTYIAEQSGGAYYRYDSVDDLKERLHQDGFFNIQTHITNREVLGYQNPFWFILVVLLLSAEWVIRKVVSLP
ncbi:MAG: hypothetical protein WD267_09225 [Balneolales bacterium]